MYRMLFAVGVLFLTNNIAYAYLDGGTGSMLLQLLLGGFVGLFAVIKLYWYRIKSFFTGKPIEPLTESEDEFKTSESSESQKN